MNVTIRRPRAASVAARIALILSATLVFMLLVTSARSAQVPVALGTAGPFSALAGSTITNTGATALSGDLGVDPGTAQTGIPPGLVGGTIHLADGVSNQAQQDLVTAYDDAAGRSPASIATDLGGQTLVAGVYNSADGTFGLTGTVVLDAQNVPGAVFIFQMATTLITATDSVVSLVNGADACTVFWQVGSSATLGTRTAFNGTILALTSITLVTGAAIEGRALARNAAVTLDTNTITTNACAAPTPTPTPVASPTATPVASPTPTPIASPTPTPFGSPTPTPELSPSPAPTGEAGGSQATLPPTDVATRPPGPGLGMSVAATFVMLMLTGLLTIAALAIRRR